MSYFCTSNAISVLYLNLNSTVDLPEHSSSLEQKFNLLQMKINYCFNSSLFLLK